MYTGGFRSLETLLPPDARLAHPQNDDERVRPMYDDRGLLDIEKLVTDVRTTIDPTYEWPNELNVHHFYWPESEYGHNQNDTMYGNAAVFRNLPIHKGLLPKAFHAWLHIISDPPESPDPDIMTYRNEAWMVARDLFAMARETVASKKQARRRRVYVSNNPHILKEEFNGVDVIGEAIMQEVLERNFRGFQKQLQRQEAIPKPYRIIELDGPPETIATQLGRLVVPKSLYLVHQIAA